MDRSLPGSIHGISQARTPEWVAIPFSRGSSPPRNQTQVSCIAGRFCTVWASREAWCVCVPFLKHTQTQTQTPLQDNLLRLLSLAESHQVCLPSGLEGVSHCAGKMKMSPWEGSKVEAKLTSTQTSVRKYLLSTVSVQFSGSAVSDSSWPHGLQDARLPCPSPTPGACSNSCPSSQWCHPTISSSLSPSPPAPGVIGNLTRGWRL